MPERSEFDFYNWFISIHLNGFVQLFRDSPLFGDIQNLLIVTDHIHYKQIAPWRKKNYLSENAAELFQCHLFTCRSIYLLGAISDKLYSNQMENVWLWNISTALDIDTLTNCSITCQ